MIQMDVKAAIMLLITLLLGIALGALGVGALSRQRNEQVQQLRRPLGFVAHMEEVIQPRDSTQRAKVDSVLALTAARNDSILQGANTQLRNALDSMRAHLDPMLSADQRSRLEKTAQLAPPLRPAGEGRGDRPPPEAGQPPRDGQPPRQGSPPPRDGQGRRGPPPDGRGPPGGGPPRGGPPPRP